MPFDLSTARPDGAVSGFDLSSARPAEPTPAPMRTTPAWRNPGEMLSPEGIASNPLIRLTMSAAALPMLGAAEWLPKSYGGQAAADHYRQLRGMINEGDTKGLSLGDVGEVAGSVLSPLNKLVAGLSTAKKASTITSMIGNGVKSGALGGLTQATGSADLGDKVSAVGIGALTGGGLSGLGGTAVKGYQQLAPAFSKAAARAQGARYAIKVNPDMAGQVAQELIAPNTMGPLSTAAQRAAKVNNTEFSALQAGVGERRLPSLYDLNRQAQEANRDAMVDQLNKASQNAFDRASVLAEANKNTQALVRGGVSVPAGIKPMMADDLVNKLSDAANADGVRTNSFYQKTLANLAGLIKGAADPKTGALSANDIYTLRKTEIARQLEASAGDNAKTAQAMVGSHLKDVQGIVDQAIEDATGNTGKWTKYLSDYSKARTAIEAPIEAAKEVTRQAPLGTAKVNDRLNTSFHVPNLMSAPVAVTKSVFNTIRNLGDSHTEKALAEMMLPGAGGPLQLGQLMQRQLAKQQPGLLGSGNMNLVPWFRQGLLPQDE